MSPIRNLGRPLRDFAVTRLEALHLALQQLAGRLRDSIATVIGTHVGNAIGDAVRAALDRRLPNDDEDPDEFDEDRSWYDQQDHEERRPHWHDPEPRERWRGMSRNTPAPASDPLPGWLPLVPPTLQGLAWLVKPLLVRWPWLGALGVGTCVALVAVLFSPLAGGLTGSAGVVFLLLRLADFACGKATDFFVR